MFKNLTATKSASTQGSPARSRIPIPIFIKTNADPGTITGGPKDIHHQRGAWKNEKMASVYHLLVYMQTDQKYIVCIYTTTGAYIDSVVFWGSLHIHQEMVLEGVQ